jgi:segregation and condensation protein B
MRLVSGPAADYSTPTRAFSEVTPLDLPARIEALLFVSAGPVTAQRLAEALGAPIAQVEDGLARLDSQLVGRGLRIQRHGSGLQLTTAAEAAGDVERYLDLESSVHLTRAALETLAIIAYRQPVTRPMIDSLRGVNSETSLHTLLRYGLIEEVGRGEGPGRPILYSTTPDFLQHFGIGGLQEMPPMETDEAAAPSGATDPAAGPATPESSP